jgi:hypothetical protein
MQKTSGFSYAFANDTNFSQGAIRSCDQWHCLFLFDFDLKIGSFGKCDSKNIPPGAESRV